MYKALALLGLWSGLALQPPPYRRLSSLIAYLPCYALGIAWPDFTLMSVTRNPEEPPSGGDRNNNLSKIGIEPGH